MRNVLFIAVTAPLVFVVITDRTDDRGADGPRSIVSYLTRRGGAEVVVPDGTYTGGVVSAAHGEWLVLRAATPGGVVVDLRTTGLSLQEGTSKVVFVGFRFVDGEVRMAGVRDVHFWYCEFTFPPEEWRRQYEAAGGTVPAGRDIRNEFAGKLANPLPTAVRLQTGGPPSDSVGLGFWGSDFHDIGDDGIFLAWARHVRLAGLRIWNVNERGTDPGQSLGSRDDWFHNDGIQTIGGLDDIEITDSWIGQKIQWGAEDAALGNATFERLWFAGSSTFGQINAVIGGGRIVESTQRDIRAFANGQGPGRYDAAQDLFRTDFVDGDQRAVWPEQHHRAGRFEMAADGVDTTVPAGVTVVGGELVNIDQVRDHVDNPANRWRQQHPYETYREVIGL